MSVFFIRNQYDLYLSKESKWVSGDNTKALYSSPVHDTALNHLIEINARDIALRASVVACEINDQGHPLLPEGTLTELV